MADLDKLFAAAQATAKILKTQPDNDTLLEPCSYFKQATEGDVSGERPGTFELRRPRQVRRQEGS